MKTLRILLALSFIYSLGFSQLSYKSLLRAAQDSTQQEKYTAAVKLLFKAKSLKNSDEDYSDKINMYLGNNYEALNKIDSSIYYYGEAVKFCETKKDFAALSFLFSRLGNIELSITKRYNIAIANFKQQLVYDKLLKDSTYFDCLNNIGIAYKSLNQYDDALIYFNQVSKNTLAHNYSKSTATLLIGDIYSILKKYYLALNYYDKAIKGFLQIKDTTGLYIAYANKGDCLMQQKRFDESLVSLKKAQQFLSPYITDVNKAVLYHNFAYVYSKQRIYDKAYYYKNLENVTLENIKTESIGNAIAEMNAKYELRKKQDSIFINKQKLVLADAKANEKQRNFIILLIVSITIIILFASIYRIRQLRFKNSLQQQQALNLSYQYQLSESELKAIRSQMNPHFIFNVLNSIEAYIMENDKKTASRLIQKFASLSRLILENSTKSLVAADREWKSLILYTELEAMRYNNSFTFNFKVDEQLQLKTLLLPPMLVQPLIENAILHGLIVDQHPDAHLEVQIKKHENGICINVEDNGTGIDNQSKTSKKTWVKEKSIGLVSIRERIDMINKQEENYKASFSINQRAEGGTIAVICLPIFNEITTSIPN